MYVFGADIVAPCNGDVVAIRDGLPNRELMDPDVSNRYGNHVIVLCEGRSVVLAHMQRGTVGVRVGEPVKTGQKVGEVGNSGSTIEPHLHIHAVEGRSEDGSGVAVPVLIDGRFLIKGATFGG
jgi:murein DD-endopeptidase MepM/ murein hydrolase activator NlpD